MALRRSIPLLTAAALLPVVAGARQLDTMVWQPNPYALLQISANSLSATDADGVVNFSGNVRLTQGDVHIQCSRARVWYHKIPRSNRSVTDRVECVP